MANNAFYLMKVVGNRDNVEAFIRAMKWQGEYTEQGIGRVFNADVYEQEDNYAMIEGDCAWSVVSAMRNEGNPNNIEKLSTRLNLAIEVYCEECGFEFQEHFLVMNGDVIIDECVDWEEYAVEDFETKEEAERFAKQMERKPMQAPQPQKRLVLDENGNFVTEDVFESAKTYKAEISGNAAPPAPPQDAPAPQLWWRRTGEETLIIDRKNDDYKVKEIRPLKKTVPEEKTDETENKENE